MFPSLYGAVSQGAAAASWWVIAGKTCVAAYQPIGAASLAASYVNLANPGTYDAAPGVAPTWASGTGWTFNGSTQYLTTGVVVAQNWSAIVRYSNATLTTTPVLLGARSGGDNRFALLSYVTTTTVGYAANGAITSVTPSQTGGNLAIAGQTGYRNGSVDATGLGFTAAPTHPLFVGALNNSGTALVFYAGNIQAIAIYSNTLSGAEVAALTSTMAALT